MHHRIAGDRADPLIAVTGETVRGVVYGILGTAIVQGMLTSFGLWLAARRLNRGRFAWGDKTHGARATLSAEQLQQLDDAYRFNPDVTLIFVLKTLFFSLAVAFVPMAAGAQPDADGGYARRSDITEFARLLSVILLLEVVSLMGNYY